MSKHLDRVHLSRIKAPYVMLLEINKDNPDARKVLKINEILTKGGVIIYPTDTVYGLGCDMNNQKAIERICRLRNLNPKKVHLSIVCRNLSQISEFTLPIDNRIFRMLRKNLPGPFTFILKGNNRLPKIFKNRRKTIGIRIPNNNIALALLESLDRPILSISLKSEDEFTEYLTDPFDIETQFGSQVDAIIDGGTSNHEPSTIVDCTNGEPEVLRQGAGELID